jgi:hypothetical protein
LGGLCIGAFIENWSLGVINYHNNPILDTIEPTPSPGNNHSNRLFHHLVIFFLKLELPNVKGIALRALNFVSDSARILARLFKNLCVKNPKGLTLLSVLTL